MSFEIACSNVSETQKLAKKIAEIAKKGDAFLLFGTLGAGKSVFARAFVQSLTKAKEVPSPTFTLVQTYEASEFEIYHFDLYRLKSAEEIWELNMEEALYQAVCLIEWPEKMGGYIPRDAFRISVLSTSGNARIFKIETSSAEKQARLEQLFIQR